MKNNSTSKLEESTKKLLGVGSEPKFSSSSFIGKLDIIRGFNYYSATSDCNKSKEWVLAYINGKDDLKPFFKNVDMVKAAFFGNLGYMCRMIQRGALFTEDKIQALHSDIVELVEFYTKPVKISKSIPNPQFPRYLHQIDDLEDQAISTDKPLKVIFTPQNARDSNIVAGICRDKIKDISENPDDYLPGTATKLKKLYAEIIKQVSTTTVKEPVKKKITAPDKVVKNIKISAGAPEVGVKGLPAVKIVGVKEALLYNRKYRRVMHFVAADGELVSVKGKTIVGFDPQKSFGRTVTKPEEFFREWASKPSIPFGALSSKLGKLQTTIGPASPIVKEDLVILSVK